MINQRKIVLNALLQMCENSGYSNIILQNAFVKNDVPPKSRPFITKLFYGVLDRMITLDYVISKFVKKPIGKIAPITLFSLRMAVYQIMYMDKVPDRAAVNEAVKLVTSSREKYNAPFVNAVLRNILRQGIKLPDGEEISSLKIKYSCPEWIIESFIEDYGTDNAKLILSNSLSSPEITVRINTALISDDKFSGEMLKEGIAVKLSDKTVHAATFAEGTDIKSLVAFNKGYFHVEDLPSQIAISSLKVVEGERVLDMCASPGGKTFCASQDGGETAEIIACDIHESRVGLIKSGAERLRLKNIKAIQQDARIINENLGSFDAVICDVPCSGLGVIRRKPEIKYKNNLDFDELKKTQSEILCNGIKYLKKGGRLLYSTCTLRKAENEDIVRACLSENSDFELEYEHTFLPDECKTDGFYFAILKSR